MSIALTLDAATGRRAEIALTDPLNIDSIEPRNVATDLALGSTSTAEVQLSQSGQVTRVMGTLSLDENVNTTAGTVSLGASVTDYFDQIWLDAVNANGPALAAYDLNASGTNAGAYAIGVDPALLANATATDLMTVLDELDAAITAGGADTLQTAYAAGNTIAVTSGNGSVALSNDTNTDATDVLQLGRAPAGVTAGDALQVTMGLNASGRGVLIDTTASTTGAATGLEILAPAAGGGGGDPLAVRQGAADRVEINTDGQILITSADDQNAVVQAGGSGAAGLQTTGTGSALVQTTSTGDVVLNANGGGDVNIQEGGATRIAVAAAGSVSIDPASGQNAVVNTLGAGDIDLNSGDEITLDATNGISLDAGAASNFSTSAGNLTLDAAGTSEVQLSHAGGVTRVLGDLVVDGATTTVDSETVLVADNHLYLNAGYTTAAAETGGLVVNYLPIATTDTVNAAYVAGVPATSNPTVGTVGAATFAVGQFVQFSGASDGKNEGLYEVLSHAANVLTIRGVGLTGTVEDFTQNDFEAVASNGAAITRVTIAVLRAGTDGIFETAAGATTGLTFTDIGSGSGNDLQQAYVAGNTIDMSAAEGDLVIDATDAVAFQLQDGSVNVLEMSTAGALNLDPTSGQNLTATVAGAGSIVLNNTGTGAIQLQDGGVDVVAISAVGQVDVTPPVNQDVLITTTGTGDIVLTSPSSVALDASGAAAGAIQISAGSAGDIDFDARGSGTITFNQAGDTVLDLTGAGEVLNGATSLLGAINRIARAMDTGGQAGIKDYVVENGVTITAGDVVAQGTVSGRVTQMNANADTASSFVGVALETGTGDVGGTVLVRVALPGNHISDSGLVGASAGDALFAPDGTGRPVIPASRPVGSGDVNMRIGYAHTSTEYVVNPGEATILS